MNKPGVSKRSYLFLQNSSSVVSKDPKCHQQFNFDSIQKQLETDKVSHDMFSK